MGTIANLQADVVQLLSGRATVAVALGQKGKPLRAIAGLLAQIPPEDGRCSHSGAQYRH